MAKFLNIQFSARRSVDIVMSTFRHKFPRGKRKLPLFGGKKSRKKVLSYGGRIDNPIRITAFWLPFFMVIFQTVESPKFVIYKNDDLMTKCFIEYEFWKETKNSFDLDEFIAYIAYKYQAYKHDVETACKQLAVHTGKQRTDAKVS